MTSVQAPYRQIAEGCGGTFLFSVHDSSTTKDSSTLRPIFKMPDIPHIGTTDCLTCVGVYLPICRRRCFVAHIDGYVPTVIGTFSGPTERQRRSDITTSEGYAIRAEVTRRLELHARDNRWTREDVLECLADNEFPAKAVIVCSKMERTSPGPFIIQGINDFLGPGVDLMQVCRSDTVGFLVDQTWKTGPFFIGYDGVGRGTDSKAHKPVMDNSQRLDWRIGV